MNAIWIERTREEIESPALLVDLAALDHNLATMGSIVSASKATYRPHCKTHKSPLIAHKQIAAGAVGVCCAKLAEAEVMIDAGVPDVLITSPVIGQPKIRRLATLARTARVAVVVDNSDVIDALKAAVARAGSELGVLVEVDVGQQRCGVTPGEAAVALARQITDSKGLVFRGLQGYQGKLQLEPNASRRRDGVRVALARLLESAEMVRRSGIEVRTLTGGGTGTLALDLDFGGLTELQPGSYVYMDHRYTAIEWTGPDTRPPFRAALSVLASVISRPTRNRAVVDTGWKAISSDGGMPLVKDLPGARFTFAGDEHGVLEWDTACPLQVGDVVELHPSHCDTTVNLYDRCFALRDGTVEQLWSIPARGRTQ